MSKTDSGGTQNLSDLRIMLLGNKRSDKSSLGNIILNREEFDLKTSAQCVKRLREVADRHITVIEAPGWWIDEPVEESTELLKEEILFSVSLCPPGPHVFLLVVRVDTRFKEDDRKVFQGYVDLLSERVWSHTIVLFTHGDFLGDTTIEKHIEREGEDLQWLVDKCGNRYHLLNNNNRSDETQIKDLLKKIEETLTENNGCCFELDRNILREMEERRRAEEERAEERMKRMKKQREMIRSQMSETQKLSDLRIVLMGYKCAGKSSLGNIILNREEFDLKRSAQCVKKQREVADRHITVIEAPGWWRNEPVELSTELLKEEILLSVSLCPPGPHIVLLVIRVDRRFKEDERKVFEGYVDLLSERVWSHTIVLFTRGDFLGDTTIEKHIESEGEDLQWLVEKCGNRYHILNNNNRSDETQIKDLLEKIEETVTENNGCCFELDRKILQEIEERRRAEEERAEERMKRMKKQREMVRSQMGETQKLSDLRIVLMGYKCAGKSSSGNIILNRKKFNLKTSAQCVKRQRDVADRHITVIEAPGWWIDEPVEKSTELLKEEILLSVSLCPPGPHIVLLVICVDYRFKEDERKVLQGYVDLLGERVWSHTIVLFTHGDFLGDTTIEQHIESEGEDLQWLVEKCGNRYHLLNNKNRSDETQIKDLLEKIEETVTENNGCCFEMDRKRAEVPLEKMFDTVFLMSSAYGSVRSRSELDAAVPSALAFVQRCRRTWKKAREIMIWSFRTVKAAADHRRSSPPAFVCGQRVWLSTKDLPSRKLAPRFIGPYRITKVVNPVAVRLKLPPTLSRVHPVFHISRVKPFFSSKLNPATNRPAPSLPLVLWMALRLTQSDGYSTFADVAVVFSTLWTGRGMAQRKGVGFRPATSWTGR
ncbi:GTPase IMAP family member 8-like [Paramisgurnus dabryanus]|uniref:GTPase IMAP family member 8-like n=1 Tax=Paramisgurnus dabryanus TaxID=90735 RepID=UPI003CCF945D